MKSIFLALLLIVVLACSNGSGSSDFENRNAAAYDMTEQTVLETSSLKSASIPNEDFEQKIIKESYLRFETQDLDKTYDQIIGFVKQYNGYVQNDYTSKNYDRITRNLTVRIPTQNFQNAIDSISNEVKFFDEKRISSKDVTEEFIDLEARLNAKKKLESRYLDLLSKANNVKDILEVERELSKIREEIEARQGRLKYLENRVSLSTLNIEFYKLTSETGATISYGTKIWRAIKSGFDNLSVFFLGLLHIWPFILILTIGLLWLRKKLIKKPKK